MQRFLGNVNLRATKARPLFQNVVLWNLFWWSKTTRIVLPSVIIIVNVSNLEC